MFHARLVQLPLIPVGIWLLSADPGAVAFAAKIASAYAISADQVRIVPTVGRMMLGPFQEGPVLPLVSGIRNSLMRGSLNSETAARTLWLAAGNPAESLSATPNKLEPSKTSRRPPPVPVEQAPEPKIEQNESPSILEILENHKQEAWIGAAIAIGFFFVGWITGATYCVRRERRRRTKLRF